MNSIGKDCQPLKEDYDACFNGWFKDSFLKGKKTYDPCAKLLEQYKECVKKAIKEKNIELWEIDRDVLGTKDEKQPPNK